MRLDTTTALDGGVGAQFAHRSSAVEGTAVVDGGSVVHAAAANGVLPVVVPPSSAVVPLQASEAPVFFGPSGLVPSPAATLALDPTAAGAAFGVLLVPLDGGAPSTQPYPAGDLFALPLSTIASLSAWSTWSATSTASFTASTTYTFVLVGDPAAPSPVLALSDGGPATANPAYDGRGLHFVAVPNHFAPRAN